ncbi:hypothetical protein N7478_002032 [Penicillium angulare]|uniref:uncharacterized protein n=1 Tax=Penicillium angulare TaxID=116970 RepID=UPI0025425018|nr:uncharacterized protein N7478_002032 [Penicillium angulare]KAJ5289002.1 hypothetical protein N7478_002032 [Penicillium angulare]
MAFSYLFHGVDRINRAWFKITNNPTLKGRQTQVLKTPQSRKGKDHRDVKLSNCWTVAGEGAKRYGWDDADAEKWEMELLQILETGSHFLEEVESS